MFLPNYICDVEQSDDARNFCSCVYSYIYQKLESVVAKSSYDKQGKNAFYNIVKQPHVPNLWFYINMIILCNWNGYEWNIVIVI